MLSSITRLHARLGSYPEALASYRAARLSACLRELDGLETSAARNLRRRALLRLGQPATLPEKDVAREASGDIECGEATLLQSVSALRVGDRARALAMLLTARAYAFMSDCAPLEAEVEYYGALTAFADAELIETSMGCRRVLAVVPASRDDAYVVSLRNVRARAFELLGLVEAAGGRYSAQLPLVLASLSELQRSGERDVYQEANHLGNLAVLVRDFDLADDAIELRERAETLPWTDEISSRHFQVLESLGWCSALRGDHLGAFRYFRRAAGVATTTPEHVYASVDRALLAYELEQRFVAAEEVEHALDLAEAYHWESSAGDDALALVWLAQAAAPLAPQRARAALERYGRSRASISPLSVARIEVRVQAEEAFAEGLVARAEGRLDAAVERLRYAFERWQSIAYDWRAARAAIELAELGAGDLYREFARRELVTRATSWLARRASASTKSA